MQSRRDERMKRLNKMEDFHTPISLVKVNNGELVVDDNALVRLLSQSNVQDRPLVIISIAGAFRTGKSFILNFFIRYLRAKGWENPNWFENPNTEISYKFPVMRGYEACTKGIHVWPEVFHIPLPSGEEAAVLLVDTQGLYDGDTSPHTNARITSISTLFSSHQILNLRKEFEERDLEHFQWCVDVAKESRKLRRNDVSQMFQTLTFLIRDWERDYEYALGESTEGYLKFFLGRTSKSREITKIMESISKAFCDVGCFLLPHPGTRVTRHVGAGIRNREIDEDFRNFAKKFVEVILNPRQIAIKKTMDGKPATAGYLMTLIGTVGKVLRNSCVTAKTIVKADAQANCTLALRRALEKYKRTMTEDNLTSMRGVELDARHESACRVAERIFYREANMDDKNEIHVSFRRELRKECDMKLSYLKAANLRKQTKEKKYERLHVREVSVIGESISNFFIPESTENELTLLNEESRLAQPSGGSLTSATQQESEVVIPGAKFDGAVFGPQTNKQVNQAYDYSRATFTQHHHHYHDKAGKSSESTSVAGTSSARHAAAKEIQQAKDYVKISEDIFMDTEKPLKTGTKIYKGFQKHALDHTRELGIKMIAPYDEINVKEVEHLLRLSSHSNVVQIVHSKEFKDQHPRALYIVMELCGPQNLHDYLKEKREKRVPVNFKEAMSYSKQLVEGMVFIHRNRIIHKDMKPENVLFSLDHKQIKVSDFGISKRLGPDRFATKLTTGTKGTDGYRAPETYNAKVISQKADIYSLGLTLYSLWTNGDHPFGDDPDLWNYNIKKNENRNLSALPKEMGAKKGQFIDLLTKMLQFDPEMRPTIKEVASHPFLSYQ